MSRPHPPHSTMNFHILHDARSGEMSYLLADTAARQAVLIDPRSRDLPVLQALLSERDSQDALGLMCVSLQDIPHPLKKFIIPEEFECFQFVSLSFVGMICCDYVHPLMW